MAAVTPLPTTIEMFESFRALMKRGIVVHPGGYVTDLSPTEFMVFRPAASCVIYQHDRNTLTVNTQTTVVETEFDTPVVRNFLHNYARRRQKEEHEQRLKTDYQYRLRWEASQVLTNLSKAPLLREEEPQRVPLGDTCHPTEEGLASQLRRLSTEQPRSRTASD